MPITSGEGIQVNLKETYISKNHINENISATPPFPLKLKIDVCNSCNYRCVFCPTAITHANKGYIDDTLCRKIITDSYNAGARELGISAVGEPLLNPNLEDYIFFGKELGYEYVFVNTNGYLLDDKRANKLIKSGVDSIKISFNAGTKESYRLIHGVDGYEQVVTNIKNFYKIREKCKLYLSFVVVKQTLKEVKEFKDKLAEFSDDILIWNANTRGGGDIDKRLLIGNDEFSFEWPCGQPFKTAVTTAEGYLLVCCQDFDKMTVISDLNKDNIVDAWNSENFTAFRQKHINKQFNKTICNNCLFGHSDEVIPLNAECAHYKKSEEKRADVHARVEQLIGLYTKNV